MQVKLSLAFSPLRLLPQHRGSDCSESAVGGGNQWILPTPLLKTYSALSLWNCIIGYMPVVLWFVIVFFQCCKIVMFLNNCTGSVIFFRSPDCNYLGVPQLLSKVPSSAKARPKRMVSVACPRNLEQPFTQWWQILRQSAICSCDYARLVCLVFPNVPDCIHQSKSGRTFFFKKEKQSFRA